MADGSSRRFGDHDRRDLGASAEREASVHLAEFPSDTDRWSTRFVARGANCSGATAVNGALEGAAQEIGNALSARHRIRVGLTADLLERHAADLPMFFITSAATVGRTADGPLTVEVARAAGEVSALLARRTDAVADGTPVSQRCADVVGGCCFRTLRPAPPDRPAPGSRPRSRFRRFTRRLSPAPDSSGR
jgi:hypothetical protein